MNNFCGELLRKGLQRHPPAALRAAGDIAESPA